ncbi:hypothetical protein LINGRAHAP2_LOCUS29207 [Linum grandiflorum]
MWHRPGRVLRQFEMEQPIPYTEMLEGEVMTLLGMTWRRELQVRETMKQYLAQWELRDDHVAETATLAIWSVGISTTSTWRWRSYLQSSVDKTTLCCA